MPETGLLDTNVLLLWLAGLLDSSLLRSWKRVDTFDVRDLAILSRFLHQFSKLSTTPHVLTEVSNFVDQAPAYRRLELAASLAKFAGLHEETYEPSQYLMGRSEFPLLGLTDTALAALSLDAVVVTTDFHLWGRLTALGNHAVNFHHLRTGWLVR